ncbi:MAG: neutral amino acid transporter [Phylliscum demangeonii]|nr:MAG: neutral amino acid transporter [Phylliscum demangeonii]
MSPPDDHSPARPPGLPVSPSPLPASRATSIARLASPVQSNHGASPPRPRPVPTASQLPVEQAQTPLAGAGHSSSVPGPGPSALAAALRHSSAAVSAGVGVVGDIAAPAAADAAAAPPPAAGGHPTAYGSFDRAGLAAGAGPRHVSLENAAVVKRHLVLPSDGPGSVVGGGSGRQSPSARAPHPESDENHESGSGGGPDEEEEEEFSSLRLQGGDVTRQVYRWTAEAEAQTQGQGRGQRSRSFHLLRPEPESAVLDINTIKVPGGFRRNYLRRVAPSPSPSGHGRPVDGQLEGGRGHEPAPRRTPPLLTNNFLEFLSIYGHFAGEELDEDDEVLAPGEFFASEPSDEGDLLRPSADDDGGEEGEPGEDSGLLTPGTPGKRRRRRKERASGGTNTARGAFLLLLKSFVGTGVLFLPKAFLNGGMGFSIAVLLCVAALSYYCFILLVTTRLQVDGSFGDIGGALYGSWMRDIILLSIVLSQIGFSSAYIVFTAENLQAFVLAVSKCGAYVDLKLLILAQVVIFLPLALIRDISKLAATALIADGLILLGLLYLYYFDLRTIVAQHGVADIAPFNARDWTLFIGTAIFTFEGIGLIIPIQESMRAPRQFPAVLAAVMLLITVVFLSMGALSYAAYGSRTQTVVLLNLPQDDRLANGVQLAYSLAILLSTPLQLFPAIRITENAVFARSGKYNPYIKWQKNVFRFAFVVLCAAIAWAGADDLDKFVALVGSFACVPLVYVYPPMLHLKAVPGSRRQRFADVLLAVFGLVVMVYTTALTIKSWIDGKTVKRPGYCDRPGADTRPGRGLLA